jgi:membrane-associated phospholipid phosphatase
LNSITYNYGLNFIGTGVGTWAFIETGIDWKWRNIAYNNTWLSESGIPFLYIGYIVPVIAPIAAYTTGYFKNDEKLQITAIAIVQSLFLTLSTQAILKVATGRAVPGIVTEMDHIRDSREDDFSDEFDWFNFNFIAGWPSGHTANAFSFAAVISEIYHDNTALKIGAYTYAALVGLGVSVNAHWASDVLAGMLIGYAIGKTVGKSFCGLMEKGHELQKVTLYATGNSLGIIVKL